MIISPQQHCISATLLFSFIFFQSCRPDSRLNATDGKASSDEMQQQFSPSAGLRMSSLLPEDWVDAALPISTQQDGAMDNRRQFLADQKHILEMQQALYPDRPHPDVAASLNRVGIFYKVLGEVRKGLVYQEQALEMYKVLYPNQPHIHIATTLNNVGEAYEALGQAMRGLDYREQALRVLKALYPNQPHPGVAIFLNNVGIAYEALGEVRRGSVYREYALKMLKALHPNRLRPGVTISPDEYKEVVTRYYRAGFELGKELDPELSAYCITIFNQKLADA